MNCQQLIDYLNSLKELGFDLNSLPVMYLQEEKNGQVAFQTNRDDIKIINVDQCNRYESPIVKTQFKNAVLIGWVRQIDIDG